MTLEEAIKKYTDMAYEALERANTPKAPGDWSGLMSVGDDLGKACEYEELAEWLKELKKWRELKLICGFDGYVIYKEKDND